MAIIENDLIDANKNDKSEHGETLQALTNDDNFPKKAHLWNFEQAYAIGTLWAIAQENDITFLKKWIKDLTDWSLSVEAMVRKDLVEVSKYKSGANLPFAEKMFESLKRK